jgi:serine/threonine-protein kinase
VAFRCLTGHLPFEPEGLGELIVAIGTHQPPPAAAFRKDVPEAVEAWLRRAFQKDPAQRFASAKDMATALAAACDPARITSPGLEETLLAPPPVRDDRASHGGGVPNISPVATTAISATGQPSNGSLVGSARSPDEKISLPTAGIKPWLFVGAGVLVVTALVGVAVPRLRGDKSDAASSGLAQSIDLTHSGAASGATAEGPSRNPWIAIAAAPDALVLGVSSDKAPRTTRGFRPQRRVHAPTKAYELQQHEVTWDELAPFATKHPGFALGVAPADGSLPVTGVKWDAAVLYCESLAPGRTTLPTEEEWEFAARGPERRPFAW